MALTIEQWERINRIQNAVRSAPEDQKKAYVIHSIESFLKILDAGANGEPIQTTVEDELEALEQIFNVDMSPDSL